MNQAIRRVWVVTVALFLALLLAITVIQVVASDAIRANPLNNRELYRGFDTARGPILVDGEPIAESVPAESGAFEYQRVYRNAELYSGLTGFYSLNFGATGLEAAMNDQLAGSSSEQFLDRTMELITGQPPQGAQVELTIDPTMQQLAMDQLPEGTTGSVVISEPDTGRILAMASRPTYDTNLLAVHSTGQAQANMEALQQENPKLNAYLTRATQQTVGPGSTFKLIDAVAMLESGDYKIDEELDIPDAITLPGTNTQLSNFDAGLCNDADRKELSWIFAQSCNTPFALAAMELGEDKIRTTAENFGFNQEMTIPLRVAASRFPEGMDDAALAQSSLGSRDVQASALQMNMVAAAIANDGRLMTPQLIESVRRPDLSVISEFSPEEYKKSTSKKVADDLTEMMKRAVKEGTAWRADSDKVEIAVKTGTADPRTTGNVNSWITGFAPADDPQMAVTIVYEDIDYPTGSRLTSEGMKRIMETVVAQ